MAIAKDKETRYAAQPTKESLKTHLQFSRARVAKAAANKIRGSTSCQTLSMPDAIRGRVLTAFLKNGRRLCGAFQMPEGCAEGEEVCGNAHLCAVLLARGRACGGSHGAFICTEKKYLPAETPVPVRAAAASASSTTSSKAKPSSRAKRRRAESPQPSARPDAAEALSPRPKTPPKAPPSKAVPPKLIEVRGIPRLHRWPERLLGDSLQTQHRAPCLFQQCRQDLSNLTGTGWPPQKGVTLSPQP